MVWRAMKLREQLLAKKVCLVMRSSHQMRDLGEEEEEREEEEKREEEEEREEEAMGMLLKTVVAHDGRVRQSLTMESLNH